MYNIWRIFIKGNLEITAEQFCGVPCIIKYMRAKAKFSFLLRYENSHVIMCLDLNNFLHYG